MDNHSDHDSEDIKEREAAKKRDDELLRGFRELAKE